MTDYTLITTAGTVTVSGDRWTRDPDGNAYIYPDESDSSDPVAEVDADEFVGIFQQDAGRFEPSRSE